MNWVDFQGTTFNLDEVTHFEITGTDKDAKLEAYLTLIYTKPDGSMDQVFMNVAYGTKAECEQWRKEIIRGDYNIPIKEKHLITDYLSAMNDTLEKISRLVETFVKKQSEQQTKHTDQSSCSF